MKKQIQRELCVLAGQSSLLALCAILAAFGGILLWVHGSMASWIYRTLQMPLFAPGFTLFFLLWLLLYGLYGAVPAFLLLVRSVPVKQTDGILRACTACLLAYILLLAWYPLFFSAVHSVLAIPVLLAAAALRMLVCIRNLRGFLLAIPLNMMTSLLEMYFLCVTITFVLAN